LFVLFVYLANIIAFFQVDLLPEISQAPHILFDVESALKNKQLKAEVDDYLKVFAQLPHFCFLIFS
jgi:hypothetical protein